MRARLISEGGIHHFAALTKKMSHESTLRTKQANLSLRSFTVELSESTEVTPTQLNIG